MRLIKKILPLSCKKVIDKSLNGFFTKRRLDVQEREQIKSKLSLLEQELSLSQSQISYLEQELNASVVSANMANMKVLELTTLSKQNYDSIVYELSTTKRKLDFIENALIVKKEPDFIIIGAEKAGTTSLFDYLDSLDGFIGSRDKEIHFFDRDDKFEKGKDWYLSHFASDTCQKTFEATPAYMISRFAPKRIKETLGTSKFIVILRDPVDRAFSSWNMWRQAYYDNDRKQHILTNFLREDSYFYKLLESSNFYTLKMAVSQDIQKYYDKSLELFPGYVRNGLYYDQLQRYLNHYNIESFLFVDFEDLKSDVPKVLKQVFDFLDISEQDCQRLLDTFEVPQQNVSNKGEYKSYSNEDKETLEYLREFYNPHNQKLFDLIGKKFDW